MTLAAYPALVPSLAQRELENVRTADISKPPAALITSIEAVIAQHPHARLVRDGVGDNKYSISIMGSSRIVGASQTASGAWYDAASKLA